MGRSLVYYARGLLGAARHPSQTVDSPMLVWARAEKAAEEMPLATVSSGEEQSRPEVGQKLAYEVRKQSRKLNPFTFGVTVGRVDNNDVALDDKSVSRFHAYLQETKAGWVLVDADSKNGTFLDGRKLSKGEKAPLNDGAKIRFGEVEVDFLLPDSFLALLQQMLA